MIFLDFLKVKKNMKICSKTHQIAPLKKNLANAWQVPPPPNNSWPPLANPAHAHELQL